MAEVAMFDASKVEKTGQGIPDEVSNLGDVADARTRNEDGTLASGEEETNQNTDENQDSKTPEQIETERLAEEERVSKRTPEEIETERVAAEAKLNEGKTPEQVAEEKKTADEKANQENIQKIKDEARKEFLKSLGVNSEEELKEKLNPTKQRTEEEKKADEQEYTANLLNFATREKLFNTNDFATLQSLKQTSDSDLAYGAFSDDYKELNKDRVGDDKQPNPPTDAEIKEAFNQQYHIDSEDKGLKTIGEKLIKTAADAKRNELEAKYNDAKLAYDDYAYRDKNSKPFLNFINKTVNTNIPTQLTTKGKDGTDIVYNIKNPDLKELEKIFVNDKAFDDYLANGESQPAKDYIAKTIEVYLWNKNKDAILENVASVSYDAGLKKGKVGASAPFGSNQQTQQKAGNGEKELTQAEKEKLKASFGSTFGRG
jgi:hypothetical protein